MEVAAAIRARILSISAVAALINTRVWTGPRFPQSPTLPAAKVLRVDTTETGQLKGTSGLVRARVQVDIIAKRQDTADAVAAAIAGDGAGSGLGFWSGEIGSPPFVVFCVEPIDDSQQFFDPDEREEYRVMQEYWVSFAR